jgi:hypothetical protein
VLPCSGSTPQPPRRTRRKAARRGMTVAELIALPASIDMETLFAALGIGRTKGYELLRSGELPVSVLQFGRTYRARTAEVLELLGVDLAAVSAPKGAA